MDAAGGTAYGVVILNLLLLLSALLSALTGVTGGGRALPAPQEVSQVAVSASPTAIVTGNLTARRTQPLAAMIVSAIAPIAVPASRDVASALLTNRRRE